MLAEAAAATLLALAALPSVLAEAAAATLLAVAVVALPPVLAGAAAAAAFLALTAQPPVLAAAAYLAPHGPQTMRARCATNSQRTKRLVPIDERAQKADPRSQERSLVSLEKKTGQETRENLLKRFLRMLRILSHRFCRFLCIEGDPKSRRSHPTGAALGKSRNLGQLLTCGDLQIPAKEIPFFLKRAI